MGAKKLAAKLSRKARQTKAIQLRLSGATLQVISDKLAYGSPSNARRDIEAAVKDVVKEPTEELVKLECDRLDVMLYAVWPKVKKGSLPAIDRALRISERRSALLGLDAPKQTKIDADVGGLAAFLAQAFEPLKPPDPTPAPPPPPPP